MTEPLSPMRDRHKALTILPGSAHSSSREGISEDRRKACWRQRPPLRVHISCDEGISAGIYVSLVAVREKWPDMAMPGRCMDTRHGRVE